jgi:hypothetical protein
MAIARGSVSPAGFFEPGLRKIFMDVGSERPDEYTQIVNLESSTRRYEEDSEWVTLGPTPAKPEGTSTTFDDPLFNSNQKRYTHISYGLATRITHETVEDELYNQMNKIPAALARSNKELIEQSVANVFINGVTGGTELDINGETLFMNATGHSKLNGGNYDVNEVSTAFSFTGMQAMTNYFEGQTNDRGMVMHMAPAKIIIPTALRFTAREIFNSSLKPFTSDNEINSVMPELGMEMVCINHYLTSDTNWFVLGDNKEDMWPNFFWREKPSFKAFDDDLSGDIMNKTYLRFSVGVTKAVGMYASTA